MTAIAAANTCCKRGRGIRWRNAAAHAARHGRPARRWNPALQLRRGFTPGTAPPILSDRRSL